MTDGSIRAAKEEAERLALEFSVPMIFYNPWRVITGQEERPDMWLIETPDGFLLKFCMCDKLPLHAIVNPNKIEQS